MDHSQISFLRRMIDSPSPSGFEQPVQQVIREELQTYTDEMHTDFHGNVVAALNPQGTPRVMLTAHCDEIGFLIRYIDEQGFLYFAPIGGFDTATLPGERVAIHTLNGSIPGVIGRKPIHTLSGDERNGLPKIQDLWIDIGASSSEEAKKLVPIGSPATRSAQLQALANNIVVSRALDDKAGVFTITEAVKRLSAQRESLKAGVYFASTVQEEVGSRGAITAAYSIQPQIAIAVDVTYTSDHPGTSKIEIGEVKLNGGPVITVGGTINPRIYQLLVETANKAGMAWQIDPQASRTFTDADEIQVARGGIATALISIPCRYLHTGTEMVALKDIDESAELIARFVLALDEKTNLIP